MGRVRVRARACTTVVAAAMVVGLAVTAASASALTLTPISTGFNSPIGIDYHQPSNKVVMSVNYLTNGQPYNFELVAANGGRTQFSAINGLTDELKLATVRSGTCQGGFIAGELFTGNGLPGQVVRVSADGSSIQNPWVTLTGETGLMRGSLFQDRYCVAGGDLVVVTTAGGVWRITSAGSATKLASLNTHLEGVTTVPDDAKYGPWAGKILTGAEGQTLFYAIDPATGATTSHNLGINPEDVDIIPPNENFFGVDFGGSRLMGAPASEFCNMRGDILATQESPGILYDVRWNGSAFVTTNLASVTQWEHVTFAPVGLVEIPPPPAASIDDVTVDESAGSATFTVKLSHAVSGPCPDAVSVHYATSNGTATAPGDYTSESGTLVFGPGEDTKTITVPIVDDTVAEDDETFFVDLTDPQGATLADPHGIGTIVDNDAKISINDVTVTEGNSGTTPATFKVTLNHTSSKTVKVNFATANGSAVAPADYATTSGTVTFLPGETTQDVVVLVKGDTIDEPDETFTVNLTGAINAGIADPTGVGTIIDDERNGRFSCRASALNLLGLVEPVVANPPDAPCKDDSAGLLSAVLNVIGLGATVSVPNANTDQTPNDLSSSPPAIGDQATAHADTTNASISLGITATTTVADAKAECTGSGVPALSSSSRVVGLRVNGQSYPVLTQPVTIPLALATLRINATINGPGRVTRRAIWLDNALLPDVIIGEATADYSGNPCDA